MIVLGTNVLPELLRPAPEARGLAWLEEQPPASLFTSAVTQGEILDGIRLLPDGQRRRKLWGAVLTICNEDFAGRVLSFDGDAAVAHAESSASRRAAGRPISQFDAAIAAITRFS